MANSPSGPTLTCSQCSFANEAERVYCHNCGAKLDRSLLPKVEETNKESLEKARQRVKKMTNPSGGGVFREFKALGSCIVYGALVALIIGIVREPEGVPPVKPKEAELPRMIGSELAEAAESPQARVLQFTDGEANNYLRTALKSKVSGMLPGVDFDRAFVTFAPGTVHVCVQQSLFGFPLYSGARYRIGVKAGKFFAENNGGNIGRISVDPAVMKYAVTAFQPMWKALKRESDQIQGMQNVTVEKGQIQLNTRGRGR